MMLKLAHRSSVSIFIIILIIVPCLLHNTHTVPVVCRRTAEGRACSLEPRLCMLVLKAFQECHDYLVRSFRGLPRVQISEPQVAFYLFIDLGSYWIQYRWGQERFGDD